ncbi:MAG: hypothetical protein GXY06_03440 [Clostridiaceae bacterium]|nr:hypothetical protein [Clostridiaceae bacterium]
MQYGIAFIRAENLVDMDGSNCHVSRLADNLLEIETVHVRSLQEFVPSCPMFFEKPTSI